MLKVASSIVIGDPNLITPVPSACRVRSRLASALSRADRMREVDCFCTSSLASPSDRPIDPCESENSPVDVLSSIPRPGEDCVPPGTAVKIDPTKDFLLVSTGSELSSNRSVSELETSVSRVRSDILRVATLSLHKVLLVYLYFFLEDESTMSAAPHLFTTVVKPLI